MQNNKLDRARQFLPFDALKGFKEMLLEKEREIEERRELSLDNIDAIDIIKRIDNVYKKIYLNNKIIDFKDIIKIEIVK